MESVLNMIFSAENIRMLVLLAFGYVCLTRFRVSIEKRIDGVEASLNKQIYELKHNDIAHLNSSIEALTYALEKNGSLKKEDKDFIDSRLAH